MHCNLPGSFPVYAITGDNKFILKDFKKYAASSARNPKWNLVRQKTQDGDIVFDSDPSLQSQSGLMNNWLGYGRKLLSRGTETGIITEIIESSKVILSMSSEVDKKSSIETRFAGTDMTSDNVDESYWNNYYRNIQGLANLSRIELAVSYSNQYYNVLPLDIVMFNENSTSTENRYADYHSGLYIVSKVITSIVNRNLVTTLLLNREAVNMVSNS